MKLKKAVKFDRKVQSLLLEDPKGLEKVFMPGLDKKPLYIYFVNVFSPGVNYFLLFSDMFILHVQVSNNRKTLCQKMATFLLLYNFCF